VPPAGRIAALDVGDRRIGVAVSDPLRLFARPVGIIRRSDLDSDVACVRDCLRREEAVAVVVGLPLLPSGDRGEQAVKVEKFAGALAGVLGIPIDMWDESYTTLEAELRQRERGRRRDRRAAPALDAQAAAVILEEWLRVHESSVVRAGTQPESSA
jgi:putative Holliday junction resolvase